MIVFGCPSYCRRTLNHFDLIEMLLTINDRDKVLKTDGGLKIVA